MKIIKHALFIVFIFSLICCSSDKSTIDDENPLVVKEEYTLITEDGFTINVNEKIVAGTNTARALALLKSDLQKLVALLPTDVVNQLRSKTIWVESVSGVQSVLYHVSNTKVPEKEGCVEIGNLFEYYDRVNLKQPYLLLHSLALLYLDQFVSNDQKNLLEQTYNAAIAERKYQSVYGTNGIKLILNQTPDAKKDKETYFAELTEAYWGENDFFPFDYAELERYDNDGFVLMEAIWGTRSIPPNEHDITLPPTTLTQWLEYRESPLDLYYRKYVETDNLSIVSSRFVADEALVQCKKIVHAMMQRIPEAATVMNEHHFRIGVVGAYENITDMPECRKFNQYWPETNWDTRGRGYGATDYVPLMTCGEENIIKIMNYTERYPTESIMVHEFAHNIDFALRLINAPFLDFANGIEFGTTLDNAYNHAYTSGLWAGTYSMENVAEYFAEGVQAWFNTCNMYVTIGGARTKLKTREQLKNYDIQLYNLLSRIMPTITLTGYHFDYE